MSAFVTRSPEAWKRRLTGALVVGNVDAFPQLYASQVVRAGVVISDLMLHGATLRDGTHIRPSWKEIILAPSIHQIGHSATIYHRRNGIDLEYEHSVPREPNRDRGAHRRKISEGDIRHIVRRVLANVICTTADYAAAVLPTQAPSPNLFGELALAVRDVVSLHPDSYTLISSLYGGDHTPEAHALDQIWRIGAGVLDSDKIRGQSALYRTELAATARDRVARRILVASAQQSLSQEMYGALLTAQPEVEETLGRALPPDVSVNFTAGTVYEQPSQNAYMVSDNFVPRPDDIRRFYS
ncbi:MAG TPA: hypothetical protein VKQ34_02385 [Candidatus Saccharimonadales bacterium]|nr:hypothetical protein [Candidatus Saccharimonadales bacterium]